MGPYWVHLVLQGLVLFLQAQALALGGAGQGAGYAPVLEHVPSASSRGMLLSTWWTVVACWLHSWPVTHSSNPWQPAS